MIWNFTSIFLWINKKKTVSSLECFATAQPQLVSLRLISFQFFKLPKISLLDWNSSKAALTEKNYVNPWWLLYNLSRVFPSSRVMHNSPEILLHHLLYQKPVFTVNFYIIATFRFRRNCAPNCCDVNLRGTWILWNRRSCNWSQRMNFINNPWQALSGQGLGQQQIGSCRKYCSWKSCQSTHLMMTFDSFLTIDASSVLTTILR